MVIKTSINGALNRDINKYTEPIIELHRAGRIERAHPGMGVGTCRYAAGGSAPGSVTSPELSPVSAI